MKVTVSKNIEIIDSNIPYQDYPEYDPGKTYSKLDKVTVLAEKLNYICTEDNTHGKTPKDNPDIWIPAPINVCSMLDPQLDVKTKNKDEIYLKFKAFNIDSICFYALDAISIDIKIVDNNKEVLLEKNYPLNTALLDGFGDYLFEEEEYKDKLRISLVTFGYVTVELNINKQGSDAECGYLLVGRSQGLGLTQTGTVGDGLSFGIKERNVWGHVKLQKGNTADTLSIPVHLEGSHIDIVKRRIEKLDGVVIGIHADPRNKMESLNLIGFIAGIRMPYDPRDITYNLEVETLAKG